MKRRYLPWLFASLALVTLTLWKLGPATSSFSGPRPIRFLHGHRVSLGPLAVSGTTNIPPIATTATSSPGQTASIQSDAPPIVHHPAWPGARVLAQRESPPINGLSTRATLLVPTNLPYAVSVEEQFNQLEAPDEQRLVRRQERVASHVLVQLRPGRTSADLADVCRQFGGAVRPHPTAPSLVYVDLPAVELDGVQRALDTLSHYPDFIDYAEPDAIVRAAATVPNDPRFSPEQWGLNNTGQDGGTADLDLDAPEGWDLGREATNVIVAVVDSGIRLTHEDLAANLWHNPGEIPGNGLDDDGNGYVDDVFGINAINHSSDPSDDLPDPVLGVGGHGTSVAGVIGAVGNNGKGITGVAWKVQLMALKWFNNQGAGALSDAIQCLDYARVKGAAIINASWQQGGLLSGSVQQSMMDALQRLREAGILFVASAGNDGANNDLVAHYPSNYPFDHMVAVAAGTRAGALWRQSNYGERLVDVVAPGENILAPTSKADNDYSLVSGTSFAAPHVSGILALLKAQYPTADHRSLIQRLLAGAERRDRLAGKVRTGGFVNLHGALTRTNAVDFPEISAFTLNDTEVGSQQEIPLLQGTNATLAATINGSAPRSFAWRHDGKPVANETSSTFTLRNFTAADIGEYQLAISNAAGVATLSVRLLGVVARPELATAVNAAQQPFLSSGQVLWDGQTIVTRDGTNAGASGRIAARQNTLASTVVTGPGKATFSWKVSSERNNDTLDLLIDNERIESISGEVDWTRKDFAISPGPHELRWRYTKDASLSKGDDRGYLDLFEFTPDAKTPPTITTQPASQTALEGRPVFFSVVATGSAPLNYQWQKDGNNLANALSNRLDLANVTTAAEGRYSVIVSNAAGSVVSASARLTITPAALPPRITTQPENVTADAGGVATLSVAASGTPPLRYQWTKAGLALAGQTNATLTLTNLLPANSGDYMVAVTNDAGGILSRAATLTVVQLQLAPAITKQPAGQTIAAGTRLELVVEAGGLGPFRYQWTRDGQLLAGETSSELIRTNAQPTDAGRYQVKVLSPFGATLSTVAPVLVTLATPPLAQAVNNTNLSWSTSGDRPWFRQTAVNHDGVDALQSGPIADSQFSAVTATATGPGQVSFWWKVSSEFSYDYLDFYVDDELIDGISGEWGWEEILWNLPAGDHTITWAYSRDESAGDGANAAWLDEVSFVSFNTDRPVIVRHPENQSGVAGGEATLSVEVAGATPLRYAWYQNNVAVPGATNAFLTLHPLSPDQEGFYHVSVSNRFGQTLSRIAAVTVFAGADSIDGALDHPGLGWLTFGDAGWTPQVATSWLGGSAMQSDPVFDQEAAWLGTTVTGPGIVYFSWKVSSEEGYDFLELWLDGELIDDLSGEVDWLESSILVPSGPHRVEWVYAKDESFSSGDDAGWVDAVALLPLEPREYWDYLYFTQDELLDQSVSGDDADPDGDGRNNLIEYSFDLDPFDPGDFLPTGQLQTAGPTPSFTVTYRRRTDDPSLHYERQISTDLIHWSTPNAESWTDVVIPNNNGTEDVRARLVRSGPLEPQLFVRIRVHR